MIGSLYNILKNALIIVVTVLYVVVSSGKAYASDINQVRAFSGFINYIYKNIDTTNNGGNFCIFGSDDISLHIGAIVKKENMIVIGEEINLKIDYSKCRIIYIAKNKVKDAKYYAQFFSDKGALTLGIFDGFVADGGMMSVGIGRRNFELTVNGSLVKKSGVKIGSSIASLIVE